MRRLDDDLVARRDDTRRDESRQRPRSEARRARRPLPRWWRHVRRFGPIGGVTLAVLGTAGYAVGSGAAAAAIDGVGYGMSRATAAFGLRVEEILVEGRVRTRPQDLIAALDVRRGDPIMALDLAEAKARLEELPWIREAAIERRLPGVIHLSIAEREPIALWQNKGRFMLVDREGHQIDDPAADHSGLPLVVGDDAPRKAAALIEMLETEPALMKRVRAAVLISGRRWNIKLDHLETGIDVRLPEDEPAQAWARLARLQREQALLERKVAVIDLRLPDRLVLRQTAGEAPPPPPAKPKTGKSA